MKILRFSPTCDVEVDLQIGPAGTTYMFDVRETDSGTYKIGPMASVDAFAKLVEIHNDTASKIPSKFVIEFAGYVIAELKSQSVRGLSTGVNAGEIKYTSAGTA